jgi:hypothetical protein
METVLANLVMAGWPKLPTCKRPDTFVQTAWVIQLRSLQTRWWGGGAYIFCDQIVRVQKY